MATDGTEQNVETTIELQSGQDTTDATMDIRQNIKTLSDLIANDVTDTKYDGDESQKVDESDHSKQVEEVLNDLFYMYNQHAITGPHEPRDILKLYMTAKIQDIVWFKNNKGDWVKVDLSEEEKNEDFKKELPVLYNFLMPKIKCVKEKFEVPVSIPKEGENAMSTGKRVTQIFGMLLVISWACVVAIHTVPFLVAFLMGSCIPFFCCCIPILLCIELCSDGANPVKKFLANHAATVLEAMIDFTALGFLITPPIIVYFVLLDVVDLDGWNSEIQSWMISYIAWGLFSYLSFVAVFYGIIRSISADDESQSTRGDAAIQRVMDAVFWVLGVDFGNVSAVTLMQKGQDYFAWGCLLLFPSIASLLPSAIIGFIANFVLEEKFVLKCNEGFTNEGTNLCSQDGSGCCQVISSHDIWNVQDFVGGLASNILATWAIIRICGYLLVNASSEASVWAKRAK